MPKKERNAADAAELKTANQDRNELSSEEDLSKKLNDLGLPTFEEIDAKLNEFAGMKRSPEEIAEREKYEEEISRLKERNADLEKQIKTIRARASYWNTSNAEEIKIQALNAEKKRNKWEIENIARKIGEISRNRIINQEAAAQYETSCRECLRNIEYLQKRVNQSFENGEKEEYEKLNADLFDEKKRLKQLQTEKPAALDERTDIEFKSQELRDLFRKTYLIRLNYYLQRIADDTKFFADAEMKALSIEQASSWKNLLGNKERYLYDSAYFINAFYAGIRRSLYGMEEIAKQIDLY